MSVLKVTLGGYHPLTPMLLRSILWNQEDDPEMRYPLKGNLQYVYMDDDYETICLLLRDGPKSPSTDRKAVVQQIRGHETLKAFKVVDNYPSYVVAKFRPIMHSYATEMESGGLLNYTMHNIRHLDAKMVKMAKELGKDVQSVLTNPLETFQNNLRSIGLGIFSDDLLQVAEGIKTSLQSFKVESELKDMAEAAGISGFNRSNIKVMTVNKGGSVTDITDEIKDEYNKK